MQGSYYVHPGRICYTREMKNNDHDKLLKEDSVRHSGDKVERVEKDRRQLIKLCHFGHINRMGGLKALISDLV